MVLSPRFGDGWTLHAGDCIAGLRELADDSIDVTITDPPYEAEAHTLQRRQKGKSTRPGANQAFRAVKKSALNFAAITADQRNQVAAQIARVTRHRAVVFCQAEAIGAWRDAFNQAGMPYRRSMPWVKPDAMPSLHGRWPGQGYEAIVLAMHSTASACPIGGKSKTYTSVRARGEAPHPTTKPISLMLELVDDFSEPGDLVLDAFAGSGTTGVACRQLGRRFVGWELLDGTVPVAAEHGELTYPNYYEIACRRLSGQAARVLETQVEMFP